MSAPTDFAALWARRDFIRLAGAAAATAVLVGRAPSDDTTPTETTIYSLDDDVATTSTLPPGPNLDKFPTPQGAINELPGADNLLAWTVDDGFSEACTRRYIEFAATSGTRLTFCVIGRCRTWRTLAAELLPLVASGQIQLANHTFSHTPLKRQSNEKIISDLQRNHDFLFDTYGVDSRPFYRPPGGSRSARTDRIAASIGYTVPVMWKGVLEAVDGETPKAIVKNAKKYFKPQAIVLGHLNQLQVTKVFPDLQAIISGRGLLTVTLNDVFLV